MNRHETRRKKALERGKIRTSADSMAVLTLEKARTDAKREKLQTMHVSVDRAGAQAKALMRRRREK